MQGDHFLVLSNDHVDLQSGNYGELQPRVAATPAPSIQKAVQNAKNVSTYYRWFVHCTFHLYREDELFCCPMRGHSFCSTKQALNCAQSVEMLCLF